MNKYDALAIFRSIKPMNRRKAISRIGAGLTAGVALPWYLQSCREDDGGPEIPFDGTVAVIGAGAAGLQVADILVSKGIQVRTFEASGRAGGRVKSLSKFETSTEALIINPNSPDETPISDFPIELGAERVFGSNSKFGETITHLRAPVVDYPGISSDFYFVDGQFKTQDDLSADADFISAQNLLNSIRSFNGEAGTSIASLISSSGISERMIPILSSWLGNLSGTSNDRLGARGVAEGIEMAALDDVRWILSLNPMHDIFSSRFVSAMDTVEFNRAITSVNHTGDKIILKDSNGVEEQFEKVIITVPVTILKNGLSFTPALPSAKLAALDKIGMDASIRVFLEFKKNFWSKEAAFLRGGNICPTYFNAGIGRSQYNAALSLTINGPKAAELSASGADMIGEILAELDDVFPGQGTLNIRRDSDDNPLFIIQDWTKESFIKGGYSFPLPGGTNEDRINLATPIDNKVFFAGEATDVEGNFGTVSGALLSAVRATEELIEVIKQEI